MKGRRSLDSSSSVDGLVGGGRSEEEEEREVVRGLGREAEAGRGEGGIEVRKGCTNAAEAVRRDVVETVKQALTKSLAMEIEN
jgi:hypothetical protein